MRLRLSGAGVISFAPPRWPQSRRSASISSWAISSVSLTSPAASPPRTGAIWPTAGLITRLSLFAAFCAITVVTRVISASNSFACARIRCDLARSVSKCCCGSSGSSSDAIPEQTAHRGFPQCPIPDLHSSSASLGGPAKPSLPMIYSQTGCDLRVGSSQIAVIPFALMLRNALLIFVLALAAGLIGFSGVGGGAAGVAKILCFFLSAAFVVLVVIQRKKRQE
jgi:uncharacterized membrane protein YtjA (UPF0391 family)